MYVLLCVLGVVIACVGAAVLVNEFSDGGDDFATMFGGSLVIILGILITLAAMHMYGEKIESKTPIEPDITVVITNGVADTTYVYRR